MTAKSTKKTRQTPDANTGKKKEGDIGPLLASIQKLAQNASFFRSKAAQGHLSFKNFSRFLMMVNASLHEPGNFQAKSQIENFINSCLFKVGIGSTPLGDCGIMKSALIDSKNVVLSNYEAIVGMIALSFFDNMTIYKKVYPLDEDAVFHAMNEHGFATFECQYANLANYIVRKLKADPKYLEKVCSPDFPYGLRFSTKTFDHNCLSGLYNPRIGGLDNRGCLDLFTAANPPILEDSFNRATSTVRGGYLYPFAANMHQDQSQMWGQLNQQFNIPLYLGVNHIKLDIEVKDGDQADQEKIKDLYEELFAGAKNVWLYISPTNLITNVEASVSI